MARPVHDSSHRFGRAFEGCLHSPIWPVAHPAADAVFDRDPPIVSSIIADPAIFGNGNTFPQVYDTLGRLIFVNLTIKL